MVYNIIISGTNIHRIVIPFHRPQQFLRPAPLSVKRNSLKSQSLYSLESGTDTVRSRRSLRSSRGTIHGDEDDDDARNGHGQQHPQLSPKPMTPRRVKHRSSRRHSNGRGSTRSSRRKIQHQNPVTKLMDMQQSSAAAAALGYSAGGGGPPGRYPHMTPSLTASNLKTLNQSADPIYYNMNSSSPLLTTSHSTTGIHQQHPHQPQHGVYGHQGSGSRYPAMPPPVGHYNPTYQHSTPNLMANSSNSQELIDELYNRPPSVRSSYSNFHGVRALNNLTAGEPPIPQVPQRDRSMAFLNSAPPAYNLNYHTPPDSETTM